MNGVGEGGTLVTVDGTNAAGNPETGALDHYGGQAQISVMSIEAVAEVRILKGILPAEYGGATGGQVNMISRSGTNDFHGSVFENYQHDALFAKNAFLTSQPKGSVRFNQFGGSLGGPLVRNRAFFFGAYEGYRENAGVGLQGDVPTEQLRNQVLAASPFRETEIVLSALPLPNEAINPNVGRWRGVKTRIRRDNHVLAKGDVRVADGNLSVTYTRMRPYTDNPSTVSKTFRFKESIGLQIPGDAFNALNHVNYNNPVLNISSPVFGQITGAAAARTGQIGAKLTF